MEGKKTRAATVDGLFYPADPEQLRSLTRKLLDQAATPPGKAAAIISPHAAFEFSGRIAAEAFQSAALRKIKTVVLLGPVHRDQSNAIILPESLTFHTPLGDLDVDQQGVDELLACSTQFIRNDIPHLEEHCLEVQLPFVQVLFPKAKIIPMLMGDHHPQLIRALANGLHLTFLSANASHPLKDTLLVVTANMSAYQGDSDSEEEADHLIQLILDKDWSALAAGIERQNITSCCAPCVAAILTVQKEIGKTVALLRRGSSRDIDQNIKKVIHYAAISIE